jgi:hypothetical protein
VAKLQVSGLCGVRVSGKYLHRGTPRPLTWVFVLFWCASPFSLRYGSRAALHPTRQGSVSAHADDRTPRRFDSSFSGGESGRLRYGRCTCRRWFGEHCARRSGLLADGVRRGLHLGVLRAVELTS